MFIGVPDKRQQFWDFSTTSLQWSYSVQKLFFIILKLLMILLSLFIRFSGS